MRRGFTLVEILVVVLIIGILAAIAVPRFSGTKERAYIAQMKSDLRNLLTAQEAYHSDQGSYTVATGNLSYATSVGVTVTMTAGDSTGWSATASHTATARTCGIFIGTAAVPAGAANPGEPGCP